MTTSMSLIGKELGELLVDNGLLTPEELQRVQEEKLKTGDTLAVILARMGLATENQLKNTLELQYGCTYISLSKIDPDLSVIDLLPEKVFKQHMVIPVSVQGNRLTLAMVNPEDPLALSDIKNYVTLDIKPVVCMEDDFEVFLETIDTKRRAVAVEEAEQRAAQQAAVSEPTPVEAAPALPAAAPSTVPPSSSVDIAQAIIAQLESTSGESNGEQSVPNIPMPQETPRAATGSTAAEALMAQLEMSVQGEPLPTAPAADAPPHAESAQTPAAQPASGRQFSELNTERGEMLVETGLLSPEELEFACKEQMKDGQPLSVILPRLGFASESMIKEAFEMQFGVDYLSILSEPWDTAALDLVPEKIIRMRQSIPLYFEGNKVVLAMVNPDDLMASNDMKHRLKAYSLKKVVCLADDFDHFMDVIYPNRHGAPAAVPSEEATKTAGGNGSVSQHAANEIVASLITPATESAPTPPPQATERELPPVTSNPPPQATERELPPVASTPPPQVTERELPPVASNPPPQVTERELPPVASTPPPQVTERELPPVTPASPPQEQASPTTSSMSATRPQRRAPSTEESLMPSWLSALASEDEDEPSQPEAAPEKLASPPKLSLNAPIRRPQPLTAEIDTVSPDAMELLMEPGSVKAPPAAPVEPAPPAAPAAQAAPPSPAAIPAASEPASGSSSVEERIQAVSNIVASTQAAFDAGVEPAPSSAEQAEAGDDDIDFMDIAQQAQDATLMLLADQIIAKAIEKGCTDVHLEPQNDDVEVRYCQNGALLEDCKLLKHVLDGIVRCYKVIAGLNTAERQRPQDRKVKINMSGREVELRVTTIPGDYGEMIAMTFKYL